VPRTGKPSVSEPGNFVLGSSGLTRIGGAGPTAAGQAVNAIPIALASAPLPAAKATNAVPKATARGS
jgi:hypothetical protein